MIPGQLIEPPTGMTPRHISSKCVLPTTGLTGFAGTRSANGSAAQRRIGTEWGGDACDPLGHRDVQAKEQLTPQTDRAGSTADSVDGHAIPGARGPTRPAEETPLRRRGQRGLSARLAESLFKRPDHMEGDPMIVRALPARLPLRFAPVDTACGHHNTAASTNVSATPATHA